MSRVAHNPKNSQVLEGYKQDIVFCRHDVILGIFNNVVFFYQVQSTVDIPCQYGNFFCPWNYEWFIIVRIIVPCSGFIIISMCTRFDQKTGNRLNNPLNLGHCHFTKNEVFQYRCERIQKNYKLYHIFFINEGFIFVRCVFVFVFWYFDQSFFFQSLFEKIALGCTSSNIHFSVYSLGTHFWVHLFLCLWFDVIEHKEFWLAMWKINFFLAKLKIFFSTHSLRLSSCGNCSFRIFNC